MKHILSALSTLVLITIAFLSHVQAVELTYDFQGTFSTGPLTGQTFQGTFSYDTAGNANMQSSLPSALTVETNAPIVQLATLYRTFVSATRLNASELSGPSWELALAPAVSTLQAALPLSSFTTERSLTFIDGNSQVSTGSNVIVVRVRVIDFEDAPSALTGEYGGIDWLNQWQVYDDTCGSCPPRLAYFDSGTGLCRNFVFAQPSILQSLNASAHSQAGVMTLRSFATETCDESSVLESFGVTAEGVVSPDACALYPTQWQQPARCVEVCFEYGWELAMDNLQFVTP